MRPLPKHPADWPDNWKEAFEERAAIIEYEAGKSREEAEKLAREITNRQRKQHGRRQD